MCSERRRNQPLGPGQTGNVWRPNTIKHCLVTKHANVEVSGQVVKTCLIKQIKQLIQTAEQAWYACPHQTCLIRGCPKEQNIAHQTQEQECLMAFKFYQTRPTRCEQHQTRCPNGKMFGHQTMFDAVWSPNISVCPGP